MATGSEPVSAENLRAALREFEEMLDAKYGGGSVTPTPGAYLSVSDNVKTGGSGINWSNGYGEKSATFTVAGTYSYTLKVTNGSSFGWVTITLPNGTTLLDQGLTANVTKRYDGTLSASAGRSLTIEGDDVSVDLELSLAS